MLLVPQPVLFVADDGRLVAYRAGDTVYVSARRPRRVLDDWLEAWARPADAVRLARPDTPLRCDTLGCVAVVAGRRIALPRDGRALADDCRRADVLIAAVPVRSRCRGDGIRVIDRFDLWHHGALALADDGGRLRIVAVDDVRGVRPWSVRQAVVRKKDGAAVQ